MQKFPLDPHRDPHGETCGWKQWNKQAAASSFLDKKRRKALYSKGWKALRRLVRMRSAVRICPAAPKNLETAMVLRFFFFRDSPQIPQFMGSAKHPAKDRAKRKNVCKECHLTQRLSIAAQVSLRGLDSPELVSKFRLGQELIVSHSFFQVMDKNLIQPSRQAAVFRLQALRCNDA